LQKTDTVNKMTISRNNFMDEAEADEELLDVAGLRDKRVRAR
jgi:hypothetical protein